MDLAKYEMNINNFSVDAFGMLMALILLPIELGFSSSSSTFPFHKSENSD